MIQGHGDDWYNYANIRHNFSSNVYDGGINSTLVSHLNSHWPSLAHYPSPDARELSVAAANRLKLKPEQLLFTNGATEAFYLLAQCHVRKKALIVIPSFAEYEDAAKIHGQEIRFASYHEFAHGSITEDIVWFGNPNNPDGSVMSLEAIEALLQAYPRTLFMVDEAYMDFTEATASCISLISGYDNLIIVKSLTKTFAIPGLRLGYFISAEENIKKLAALKMPWTVNALAIMAGKFIFENYDQLIFDVGKLTERTHRFRAQLSAIDWLELLPSATHYFLAGLRVGSAAILKKTLAEKHGILIRDATNFRGLSGEYIRLAVQAEASNQQLIKALKSWT